jgi:DNA-binding MarR family transcriptional regulator
LKAAHDGHPFSLAISDLLSISFLTQLLERAELEVFRFGSFVVMVALLAKRIGSGIDSYESSHAQDCDSRCCSSYFENRTIRAVDDSTPEITESRDTLEREIVALVHQISHHGRQMFVQGLAQEKLTLTHWMILEDLMANPDGLTMRAIAHNLGLPPSSVTGLVDALEMRDWSLRRNDPSDRRVVRVELTETGIAQVRRVGEHLMRQYRNSMSDMTDAQLTTIQQMYATMLQTMLEYTRNARDHERQPAPSELETHPRSEP